MKGHLLRIALSFWACSFPCSAAPANDNFTDSTVLTGPELTVTGTNLGATKEPGEPEHGANPGGGSVWWIWTAPGSGSVIIETAGSSFDTLLAAYSGVSVAQLAIVASNDDGSGIQSSIIGFDVTAGATYHIAVDGYDGASGDIQLILAYSSSPLSRQANDNFVDRIPLDAPLLQITGTNLFATLEPGEPVPADVPGAASVWWSWTAPFATDVVIDTEGSNFDTALGVYTGPALNALKLVAENDDISTNQPTSLVTFHADANTQYQIAVDGYDGEPGLIHLQLLATDAIALDPPHPLPDGSHTVTLTGPAGKSYTLEASADLRAWDPIATLTSTNRTLTFTDPTTGEPHRFYRAKEQ